jgi:hypothetical protein
VPGNTVIEDYEPPDDGWGTVIGRFMPRPEPKAEEQPAEGEEQQSERLAAAVATGLAARMRDGLQDATRHSR